ncbi:hypothetical protein BT93_I1662 [Corymbia citriodora subsp. variegata]|nr:hypothetical protein BT93_I1662 [Corymbia citriodora subsp. variegata]KAF8013869.1 hypothetical protein BT93_I1662 [Corymbia citriodora subsp. variegata]
MGFRFWPTEEELLNHYLKLKMLGDKKVEQIIPEVDVHQLPPWDLPRKINELSSMNSDSDGWFFFCRLQNRYPQSKRTRRTNGHGSWKPTGETREIRTRDKKNILGLKKILVFKKHQSPKNTQTKWVLHEYHKNADLMDNSPNEQNDFVLYHLKQNLDNQGKKNSKIKMTNTSISIMPQESNRSSCHTPEKVNETSFSIMPQEGSRSICNMPDEINKTSSSIMPQEGSKSICNMSDEVNGTSSSIMPQESSRSICNMPYEINKTSSSIMPQEGSKSICNMPDEVNETSFSIMSQEGSGSICKMPNDVNETSFSIMPQEGSRSICNTYALVTAESIVPGEIPKESLKENVQQLPMPILSPDGNSSGCDFSATPQPPTATGEQLTNDPLFQDLESYFANDKHLKEIFGMLNSYGYF